MTNLMMKILNCQSAPPTQEAVHAQAQWIQDGTIPASYVEATVSVRFSTAEPAKVIVTAPQTYPPPDAEGPRQTR
jgi:hypothetical protein